MAIDAEQAAIRTVIATILAEQGEGSGRGLDALFAMRQAEAIVRALEHAGYEIRREDRAPPWQNRPAAFHLSGAPTGRRTVMSSGMPTGRSLRLRAPQRR
jgi:hypothetical protein